MNILSALRSDKLAILPVTLGLAVAVVCSALAIIVFAPAPASALVKFDFEQYYFHEKPIPVLDHCVVEANGVYHLFYLRGNPAVTVGHATTTDFSHWRLESPILEPGTWDTVMWAPHLIKDPNYGWYMYYTGVNQVGAQQTGIAASTDLSGWFKIPWPVYHPDPVWALWDEAVWSHGRDPHVIAYNGKYYMFVTAKTADGFGAVACAESDDWFEWTDIGPIYVHDSWHVLESVFIMARNGKFHMFFTEEAVNGTSHMASDDLFSGWDIANRRIIDSGHAPQVTVLSDGTEIFSRHAVYNNGVDELFHTIRFDTLAWAGDIPGPYKPWALSDDWIYVYGNAFAYQPVFRNNPKARGENVADTFVGNCWLGTYERYTGPLGFGTPGGIQGDSRTGVIRSKPFTITGNSINLLVGGGNNLAQLYVALVNASTGQVLYKETGKNSEEMDRRYWNLVPYSGATVYVEIADLSADAWGHINCDDITESTDIVNTGGLIGSGSKGLKGTGALQDTEAREDARGAVTGRASLGQNSPNPFNPATTIGYDVPGSGYVTLRVYDVNGKLVRTLVDEKKPAGYHTITWNGYDQVGRRAASGVYLYRLTFDGSSVATKKMIMLK